MADAVISAAASGAPVLGICGGLQMLSGAISGRRGIGAGSGLLPVVTSYLAGKTTQHTAVRFGRLPPAWSGSTASRSTATRSTTAQRRSPVPWSIVGDGLGSASRNILGIYAHGLFESDHVLDTYTGIVPPPLDDTFEQLADLIDAHVDIAWLARCLDLPALRQQST